MHGIFGPLLAGGVQFRQASARVPEEVAVFEEPVRHRALHGFSRHGLLDPDDARDSLAWVNSGFSLDAAVCIAGHDWAGLERLFLTYRERSDAMGSVNSLWVHCRTREGFRVSEGPGDQAGGPG